MTFKGENKMKRKINWQLCFILFLSISLFIQCAKQEQSNVSSTSNFQNITVQEVKKILDAKSKIILLDVRTPDEYAVEHIKGSTLIPVQELANRLKELSPKKEIVVYCKAGKRSLAASEILTNNGYKHVLNMEGGIDAWKIAGFPTEQ
jgi:rhodanese-related sulfurtransferase